MQSNHPSDLTDRQIAAAIAHLEAEEKWGREHPYAGVCGEDDARGDRLSALKQERASRAATGAR